MRKTTRVSALALCIAALSSGTSFASPLVLPSGDSHPIYFDAQNYRQSSASTLKGVFTEKHLDKVAKPSAEALAATKDAVEEVADLDQDHRGDLEQPHEPDRLGRHGARGQQHDPGHQRQDRRRPRRGREGRRLQVL